MPNPLPQTSFNLHALNVLEFDRIREIVAGHADSKEGRARLNETMPSDDAGFIRGILSEVDEFMRAINFDDLPPSLAIHDIREIFPFLKIKGYKLDIESIASVANNLELARLVKDYFESRSVKYPVLWAIARQIRHHEVVEKSIRKVITPDLMISDNASSELKSIRRKLGRARSSLRSLVEKTLDGLSDDVVSERLVTIRNNRFVIPIRDSMRKKIPGAVHDRSQTGKTLFIEPLSSIEANNTVSELEMAEHAEIQRILAALTASIAEIARDVERNQETTIDLDVIKAKARYGARIKGVIPIIADEPHIFIRKGRHPLLDWKYRKLDDGSSVVALDLEFGGDTVTVVVTGPNAGGKTVALKTVGLLTIMALSGMPVPAAADTVVYVPDNIFADIGDEQSVENDLSTFSSHMKQIVTILDEADTGSLVLFDELGGGTNPSDGEAIALAVLRALTDTGALTLATTHHGGLKVFAHEAEHVANASMEFDTDNLRPTFVFRSGIPGSSYAFEIAGRMGMPRDVLNMAEQLAGGEKKSLEGLIAEMEEHLRQADEERKAAEIERARMETVRIDYENRLEEIKSKKTELLSDAVTESKKLLEDTNRRIESSIREIREKKASREAIVEAKTEVVSLKKELDTLSVRHKKPKKKKARSPVDTLAKGLDVWVESLSSEAVIEEVLDNGKRARIRVGKSKASLVVKAKDIFKSLAQGKKKQQVVKVSVPVTNVTSNEIDLRGMTFDEARDELELFLDSHRSSGFETVHIIHGKGTGVLRKKTGAYLDKHPQVESIRLGNWNEGSYGVTVVKLKR